MGDEVLARAPPLVGVMLAREHERLDDPAPVDPLGGLLGVLLDDREQVTEQVALELGEIGRQLERRLPRRVLVQRAADLDVPGDDRADMVVLAVGRVVAVGGLGDALGGGQAARRVGWLLLRNRSPSSRRCW